MYNYRLVNSSGEILGVVSLQTEDLPKLLVAGETMILSASWDVGTLEAKAYVEFVVTPEPAREAAFDRE